MRVEVMGVVEESFRFEGLADFQYLGDPAITKALHIEGMASARTAAELLEQLSPLNVMAVPPALFSATDLPTQFIPNRGSTNLDATLSHDQVWCSPCA